MTDQELHHSIRETLIDKLSNNNSSVWLKHFNRTDKDDKIKILRLIHNGFYEAIVEQVSNQISPINLPAMGRIYIKRYRKKYLDLLRDKDNGLSKADIIKMIREEYMNEVREHGKAEIIFQRRIT